MKTDSLYYRACQVLRPVLLMLIGRSADDAKRYRFDSIEVKGTSRRIDGVLLPEPADLDELVYFIEFQQQKVRTVYSNLILKMGLYLDNIDPDQSWNSVAIYHTRTIENDHRGKYNWLFNSGQLIRIYLDELPPAEPGDYGLGILQLINQTPLQAVAKAQELIPIIRKSERSSEQRDKLIDLVETIILYILPKKSREEIEKMLQVESIRETRVFQEALEEGREEGREEIVLKLLAKNLNLKEIADLTGFSLAKIKKLKKAHGK